VLKSSLSEGERLVIEDKVPIEPAHEPSVLFANVAEESIPSGYVIKLLLNVTLKEVSSMFVLTIYESWLVEVIETSALLIQDSRIIMEPPPV
jgi:hypothetical protein